MNPTLATYLGFVVAFIIILWGVIELNRRYFRQNRRKRSEARTMRTWQPLSSSATNSAEEPMRAAPAPINEQNAPPDLQARAQQNGHYSPTRRPK